MESPLAPVMANLFMVHYEKEWLSNYDGISPSYYTRYVDNIFSVFHWHGETQRFFFYLNSRHPNVKFTMETEVNKVILFLDVLIGNRNNISNTTTYHKSTYSGLLINFDGFTSRFYKIGLIKCLIDHAYKINNTWASFHNDVTFCKTFCKDADLKRHFVNQHPTSQQTSHIPHPTSRISHIPNISHPKHLTSQTSHISNISHPEHPTFQTPYISSIPHPEPPATRQKHHMA